MYVFFWVCLGSIPTIDIITPLPPWEPNNDYEQQKSYLELKNHNDVLEYQLAQCQIEKQELQEQLDINNRKLNANEILALKSQINELQKENENVTQKNESLSSANSYLRKKNKRLQC